MVQKRNATVNANEYAFIYRVSPVTTLETITLPGMLKKKPGEGAKI